MTASVHKILKRSKALLSRPDAKKIYYVNFAVTYSCNSACKMCNIWQKYREEPAKLKEELTLPEIQELFSSPYMREIKNVHLTGGEPFLRSDFVDLVGFFIKKYPAATIFIATNSLNPGLIIERLKNIFALYSPDPRMIHLGFSVDGIGETHNIMRGRTDAYERVLEGAEKIRIHFPEIDININFTITPANARDLLAVYELSAKLGARFGTQFAQMSESFYENSDFQYSLNPKQLEEIQGQINIIHRKKHTNLKFMNKLSDVEGIYLSKLIEYQRGRRRLFRCFSGTHSFFLDPYGNIFPCIMLSRKLGNVRENRFDDLWFSQTALSVREDIRSEKCCCWTGCEVIPSLQRDYKVLLKHQLNLAKSIISRTSFLKGISA